MNIQHQENLLKGILFSILSFFLVSCMNAFAKAATPYTSSTVIVFFQNVISFVLILPFAFRHKITTTRLPMHIARALTGTLAWYCLFFSIKFIPLTNAVVLLYSSPLWMPVLSTIIFHKTEPWMIWVSVLIGFIGIVLVINPAASSFHPASLIAAFGAVNMALALFSVKSLNQTESTESILFYYFLLSSIMIAPLAVIYWQPPSPIAWLYLIGVGVTLAISQATITIAYRYTTPVKLAPYIYTTIIFTAMINWLIWNQIPTGVEFIGMAIVIVAGLATLTS